MADRNMNIERLPFGRPAGTPREIQLFDKGRDLWIGHSLACHNE